MKSKRKRGAKKKGKQSKQSKRSSNNSKSTTPTHVSRKQQQQQKQQQQKIITKEQIQQMSIGQAIQESTSIQHLLLTAQRMWIPTDDNLPQHLQLQSIHHEKRFRSACLLLEQLSELIAECGSCSNEDVDDDLLVLMDECDNDDDDSSSIRRKNDEYRIDQDDRTRMIQQEPTLSYSLLWNMKSFRRVVLAATLPFNKPSSSNNNDDKRNGKNMKFSSGIDIEKECRFVTMALVSLHTLAGFTLPPLTTITNHLSSSLSTSTTTSKSTIIDPIVIDEEIIESMQTLIQRAEGLSSQQELTLNQAIEIRWAIRGLYQRISIPNNNNLNPKIIPLPSMTIVDDGSSSRSGQRKNEHEQGQEEGDEQEQHQQQFCTMPRIPNLNRQVQNLPFDIIPNCIDWSKIQHEYYHYQNLQTTSTSNYDDNNIIINNNNNNNNDIIQTLRNEIPFNIDTITTRSGSLVQERRSTAWIADDGIGSLAYSGKLMTPSPIPPIVQYTMREVEKSILKHDENQINDIIHGEKLSSSSSSSSGAVSPPMHLDYTSQLKLCVEENGKYFDCALTNHYPDYDSACKFHTDPEHGSFWERLTCVVSAGNDDIRKFAFRPIPQINDWSQWEGVDDDSNRRKKHRSGDGDNNTNIEPAVIYLFPGDCVKMWGECNDVFHHAVYGSDNSNFSHERQKNDGRVSLVFKRAMDRGNGRKGHGQRGEGRRSRRS